MFITPPLLSSGDDLDDADDQREHDDRDDDRATVGEGPTLHEARICDVCKTPFERLHRRSPRARVVWACFACHAAAMSPRRRLAIVVTLAFVSFLVASTGHGRQLRKEREARGFLQMDQAQGWPPAMHEIWQTDRADLKTSTAVAAVVGAVAAVATGGGVWMALLAVLLWAPTVGFFTCGVFSLLRLQAADAAAATATLPGALALFGVALVCLGASVVLGLFRRPAAR